jgi:hypothetical protein
MARGSTPRPLLVSYWVLLQSQQEQQRVASLKMACLVGTSLLPWLSARPTHPGALGRPRPHLELLLRQGRAARGERPRPQLTATDAAPARPPHPPARRTRPPAGQRKCQA